MELSSTANTKKALNPARCVKSGPSRVSIDIPLKEHIHCLASEISIQRVISCNVSSKAAFNAEGWKPLAEENIKRCAAARFSTMQKFGSTWQCHPARKPPKSSPLVYHVFNLNVSRSQSPEKQKHASNTHSVSRKSVGRGEGFILPTPPHALCQVGECSPKRKSAGRSEGFMLPTPLHVLCQVGDRIPKLLDLSRCTEKLTT